MSTPRRVGPGLLLLATLSAGLAATLQAAETPSTPGKEPVRIGIIGSLFRDIPPALVKFIVQPFQDLMRLETGLNGEIIPGGDYVALGQQLAEDKVQLAVFHGFELAWAQQKHPELRPLMIAINQHRHLHAHVVVRLDCAAEGLADLKSKTLAMPRGTREHSRLFLLRRCQELGQEPKQFFEQITTPTTAEDALDDLLENNVNAALIDGVALEAYKRRKPGCFEQFKVVGKSEVFPAACVAYRPGALSDDMIGRFKAGMLNAGKTPTGRQLMTLWKLTAFEPIPEDYEQTLIDIGKAYPAPLPPTAAPPAPRPVPATTTAAPASGK